jgi:hypothetical protein
MHPAVNRCNIVILGDTWETDSSGVQALGEALAATSTLINLDLSYGAGRGTGSHQHPQKAGSRALRDHGGGGGASGGGRAARPAAACPFAAVRSRPGPGSSSGGPRRYCRRLGHRQGAGCSQRQVCLPPLPAGGEGGGSAAGREAALRRELEVVRDAAIRELRSREEATRRAEAAVGAPDEAIRGKDAEIARLRRLAFGVGVLEVDAGVTRVVEEAGAGAEPPLKRMRLEQAASARVVGALQERLATVKKEQVKERATRHSELQASVDAKMKAAVKEALAQVADALECTCCFEPLAPGAAVSLECGHTYCNHRQACASSSVTACPECRQPIGARVPLFGVLANVCGLLRVKGHFVFRQVQIWRQVQILRLVYASQREVLGRARIW